MMKLDYLPGTDIEIIQDNEMFKLTSDAYFLGQFLNIKHNDDVLDIGCNNGVLLLYASIWKPHSLTGIDIQEKAIEIARKNMDLNDIECNLYHANLNEFNLGKYSVIVCNPPYFTHPSFDKNTKYEQVARYDDEFSLVDLFIAVKRLLKDNGSFYIVNRVNNFNRMIDLASNIGMKAVKIQYFYGSLDKNAKTVAIEFKYSKNAECTVLKPFILNNN